MNKAINIENSGNNVVRVLSTAQHKTRAEFEW